ncbi:chromate resistance protein ChrB domain-containing protein [Bradyrhizobium sp. SYSU BS000235]|uniref:chromate resistance protein ChrB domain-containing protein n=1 Tax=Bradyrhizobium sp. SYSU BS000235 TaxID=3411332 RepID=UPI003C71D335
MSAINSISADKLGRLVGTPACPILIDVRTGDDFAADPKLIPSAVHRSHHEVAEWAPLYNGKPVIAICARGGKTSEGVAAWLRVAGSTANILDGGMEAWTAAKLPLVPASKIPPRDARGRTVWVTRARPKIDRIACPWLIRRFIDPSAVFLFVTASEVAPVAEQFKAVPFDIEGVHWGHRGDLCTFDIMIEEFELATQPLDRLATIVRGADTARLDLAPQASGLLAAALGLSRMYSDDLAQLDAGMLLFDAFYRWCRDATDETHNWPSHTAKKPPHSAKKVKA